MNKDLERADAEILSKPDFAFPKTVAKTAEAEYKDALRKGQPVTALRAAMELNVAESLTTTDSVIPSVERYTVLAKKLPSPYSAIADLLKARLLLSVYNSDRYDYNSRILPLEEPFDANPLLWSSEQFKKEITELCNRVMRERDKLAIYPISVIAPLINNAQEASDAGMSIYDFVCYNVVTLLLDIDVEEPVIESESIPFIIEVDKADNPNDGTEAPNQERTKQAASTANRWTPLSVLTSLVETDEEGEGNARALLYARIRRSYFLKESKERFDYNRELLDTYNINDPLYPDLVSYLINSDGFPTQTEEQQKEMYAFLEKVHKQWENNSCISEKLKDLRKPYITITHKGQILPKTESKLNYESRNLQEFYILFVKDENPLITREKRQEEYAKKPVVVTYVKVSGEAQAYPYSFKGEISVPPLEKGFYALIPSASPDYKDRFRTFEKREIPVLNVSDLSLFTTSINPKNLSDPSRAKKIYVTNAMNGAPVSGATYQCIEDNPRTKKPRIQEGVTGPEGNFTCDFDGFSVDVKYDGSRIFTPLMNKDYVYTPNTSRYGVRILTDLALYHPGDTVQAVAVMFKNDHNLLSPAKGQHFEIKLLDANRQIISELPVTTDATGRATVSFSIPKDGITGTYYIRNNFEKSKLPNEYIQNIGTSIQVAEYKAPTFLLSLLKPDINGDNILGISGSAMTYSGMPLQNQKITVNIDFSRMWWRRSSDNLPSHFSKVVTTDYEGKFNLKLGIGDMLQTGYADGYFTISAISTSDSGETQSSESRSFSIDKGFKLSAESNTIKVTGPEIKIPVKVNDILGESVVKPIRYSISDIKGETISAGKFNSPELTLSSSLLPSGKYSIQFILDEARELLSGPDKGKWEADTVKTSLVLWRETDKRPPFPTPLWVPQNLYYPQSKDIENSKVNVKVGSGYPDSYIFYQVVNCDSIISEGWVKASEANVLLPTIVPEAGNCVEVNFRSIHNLEEAKGNAIIYPVDFKKRLEFRSETFRNRLIPDSTEKWKFKLSLNDKSLANAAVMAVLSDASLNAITPFKWNFNPESIRQYYTKGGIRTIYFGNIYLSGSTGLEARSDRKCFSPIYPTFNFWNKDLYGNSGFNGIYYRKMDSFACASEIVVRGASDDGSEESAAVAYGASKRIQLTGSVADLSESAVETESEESNIDKSSPAEEGTVKFRETSHPLAFFRPLLATDTDGVVEIDFEVPNFNTTWALQLAGYDKEMNSAYFSDQVVAAKAAMVSTNMPRFLLTGDHASVSATMFNNFDSDLDLNGRIEIIDPATDNVLAFSETGSVSVKPASSNTFTVEFPVPTDCTGLIVRSFVKSEAGSDGEQEFIAVLPSSQPVLEANTFYLKPEETEASLSLPKMNKEDMVTLNYCANPSWYILTSLSGLIKPDSQSTLANLNALYSNAVATGIMTANPNLGRAVKDLFANDKADSLLISPLSRLQELKISTLNNTPWVNNANSETARMSDIITLTDEQKAQEALNIIIENLYKNRKSGGGLSWMPEMQEAQLWITLNVINCAALLKASGFEPASKKYTRLVTDALDYTDSEMVKHYEYWHRTYKEPYPLSSMLSYFLSRSYLTSKPATGVLNKMHIETLHRLPKEWRGLSIVDKSEGARFLKREGNSKLAREIMESVKEFASYKPDKGMWFDNLSGSYFSDGPQLVTSFVLQALNEVMPGDEAINKMCQYLVLSRQGEDWNLDMTPAAVTNTVNALLTSDLDWNKGEQDYMPEITLNGQKVGIPQTVQSLTGNFLMNLPAQSASEAILKITRSGGVPAWGGVLRQYVSPASKVKAASVPQLKVTKSLLPISDTQSQVKAGKASVKFKKGDRIRVTLTIESDRDLDYVLIKDCRGAFMQPEDQLTEYDVQNGLWILRETRNTATNFYLTTLPKGNYILTYDVFADRDGEYATGIATAQSQYYPLITAHSAGCLVTVD